MLRIHPDVSTVPPKAVPISTTTKGCWAPRYSSTKSLKTRSSLPILCAIVRTRFMGYGWLWSLGIPHNGNQTLVYGTYVSRRYHPGPEKSWEVMRKSWEVMRSHEKCWCHATQIHTMPMVHQVLSCAHRSWKYKNGIGQDSKPREL